MARKQPEQQAPPVQKLRLRYAKRGRARFTSSRDFSRAFERALRRAAVPMAFSSGFSPHPRISYANAAPTGAETEAEYCEIGLADRRDPAAVLAALQAAMPPGLDILEVVEASPGSLADRLQGSQWTIHLDGVAAVAEAAVEAFLAADEILVERMTKNGVRTFDARGAVRRLTVVPAEPTTFDLLLEHRVPLVRPDDVVRALGVVFEAFTPSAPPRLVRLSQGPLAGDTLGDPLAAS
ncbi:TIGR03936 family radical SAM-associated protein [Propionibacteriaceae bacterium Y1700]|uniref:TIGR03936 family radical SAM-associated protein n=1 Tax=Microlunatus sp. Y1700 TaxID=3418487 RepID=UPI003DA772A5